MENYEMSSKQKEDLLTTQIKSLLNLGAKYYSATKKATGKMSIVTQDTLETKLR